MLPLCAFFSVFAIAPPALDLPAYALVPVVEAIAVPRTPLLEPESRAGYRRDDVVFRGETTDGVLQRLDIHDPEASDFMRRDARFRFAPGRRIAVTVRDSGRIESLDYFPAADRVVTLSRDAAEKFVVDETTTELETRIETKAGVIESSLFAAADSVGLPDSIASQLADVFGGAIDFHRDLRRGDRFAVVYEVAYSDGNPVSTGAIVAAEFVNRDKTLRAFSSRANSGRLDYFGADGRSLRPEFLRSPLAFSRITSGFSNSRLHPVLGRWLAHRGVDYAAPTGTNVRATADGVVSFAGWRAGYGRTVMVRHNQHVETLYGHLSGIAPGIRPGNKVTQSQTIAYVGSSGMATGPHLHYEMLVRGQHANPAKIAFPSGERLSGARLAALQEQSLKWSVLLGQLNASELTAMF
jgi:murein DD-endopeptidase MepM/ murein hydrolase activator NlpD